MSLYNIKYARKDINKFAIFPAVPIVLNVQKLSSFRHLLFVFIEGFERERWSLCLTYKWVQRLS